jgi:type IV secretion system protein VirD4
MDKGKIALGVLSLVLVGLAMGYVVATGCVMVRFGLSPTRFDVTLLAREYLGLSQSAPKDFLWVNLILGGFGLASLMLSVTLLGDALTRFGTTHWQTRSEMKRNGFFAKPGGGFLLGKLGSPKSKRPFLVSKTFPHALIVAPTGRGKGVGFVIPNLLTYKGSAVVLDVKGENFRETSRFRASMGDKVFRFAPTDWDRPTHRYNPLARIAAMTNPDRQQMELKFTAKLFLQTDNEKLSGLLAGGIDLFVAAGLLAFERGVPTIGEIYRIIDQQRHPHFLPLPPDDIGSRHLGQPRDRRGHRNL